MRNVKGKSTLVKLGSESFEGRERQRDEQIEMESWRKTETEKEDRA